MNYAVIFAGGIGKRMTNAEKPKQFLEAHGKPIIIHTLEHFQNHNQIDKIVISCVDGWIDYLTDLLNKYHINKVEKVVSGGETGQLSIYNALKVVGDDSTDDRDIVLIHDGVRPLISRDLISENINCARKYGSAITCVKVTETIIKTTDGININQVYERDPMMVAKAPQTFFVKDILKAHKDALKSNIINSIDSCTLMSSFGYPLHLIDGDYKNIKITTPIDYFMFKAILDSNTEEV